MAPTFTGYLHRLRRPWWIPLLTVLAGFGAGLILATTARATTETRGSIYITLRVENPGEETAGSAGIAEYTIAASGLTGFVAIPRAGEDINRLLKEADITASSGDCGTAGGAKNACARVLIDAPATDGTRSGLAEGLARGSGGA